MASVASATVFSSDMSEEAFVKALADELNLEQRGPADEKEDGFFFYNKDASVVDFEDVLGEVLTDAKFVTELLQDDFGMTKYDSKRTVKRITLRLKREARAEQKKREQMQQLQQHQQGDSKEAARAARAPSQRK